MTILNEIGLDPGIDHLSAMKLINEIKSKGGVITSFTSWCGGLPAPECSDNPFGYKFSWSPQGVLKAARNSAKYLKDGKEVKIDGSELLSTVKRLNFFPGFSFEGIANRDSLKYIAQYGLDQSIQTMFRGTIRYQGFCSLLESCIQIGLLSDKPTNDVGTWESLLTDLLGNQQPLSLESRVAQKLNTNQSDEKVTRLVQAIKWLGIDGSEKLTKKTVFDNFSYILQKKLAYEKNERDLVFLRHEFGALSKDGIVETHTSTLVCYGDEKSSAMAKTVGLPAAIATEMILDRQVSQYGVIAPLREQFYSPILKKLEAEGLTIKEKVQ